MRAVITVVLVVSVAVSPVPAQPRPRALAEVGIDERVGVRLPLDLWFSDTAGRRLQLRELFDDGMPVLLALTYVRCKLLCSLVLRGMTTAVRELPLALGRDYRVVTVSLDPHEEAVSGDARRRSLMTAIGAAADQPGWSYLVGAERPIQELAASLGFRYAWDAQSEQYAHPAVVFVIAPGGQVARYLHGIEYPPGELAAALRAAKQGDLQPSSIAQAVLDCFRFDPAGRARREGIETYLRIGGAILVATVASTIVLLFLWERRRRWHR